MGTYAAVATVLCTFLEMVATKGHGMMALLVGYLWLCITTSLTAIIRFISGRIFSGEEENRKHGGSVPVRMSPATEVGKLVERKEEREDVEEEKTPPFQFRFSFQIPEHGIGNRGAQAGSAGDDGGSSTVTSVSSYRFFSEKDHRGFVEAPQAMTLRVQESYIDSNGAIQTSTEEVDRVLKRRLSSVKDFWRDEAGDGEAEKVDRELNSRLLSLNPSRRFKFDHGAFMGEKEQGRKSFDLESLGTSFLSQEVEFLDFTGVPDGAETATGDPSLPAPAGDVGVSDWDTDMESRSGGCSVKDLILDADSDGFFSEKDFGEEGETEGLEQEDKPTQLHSPPDSIEPSDDSEGEDMELMVITKNRSSAPKLGTLPSSSCPSDDGDDAIADEIMHSSAEELDWELRRRLLMVKRSGPVDSAVVPNEELDWELKRRLSSLKLSRPPDSEAEAAVGGEEKGFRSLRREDWVGADASEESRHPVMPNEVESPAGRRLFPAPAEGLDGFDSDAHSESGSDGYSVKDLMLDFDSDVLFSEDERNAEIETGASSDSPESMRHDGGPEDQPKPVCSSDAHRVDVASDEEDAAGLDSDQFHQGEDDQKEADVLVDQAEETGKLSREEEEELESIWEHDDLVDQLKMDLRRARASGLPTILEESSVNLRPAEGRSPWRPQVREDPMEVLQMFHKSYRERMRKFDVLNNQKMFAIGFLQLKDPVQSMSSKKPILPTIASVFSQSLRRRKSTIGPSEEFIKELQSDLETVYVGQSCLSWEFLRWQYERTHDLLKPDAHDARPYNQVAEEFQQFQVLIQRFLEDEPFHGPRIPNYAKSRCFLRRLLQVPVLREDSFKDKADRRRRKDAITGEQLRHVMEDSIRVFWEFVRSDEAPSPSPIVKGLFGTRAELQDPTDLGFFLDIQSRLKQKRKKFRDVLRTGNCLVKKFKKSRHGGSSQDDLFFSQVDLKLVSRVLKMSRITTDQLVWCDKKLSKICFMDRKLLREHSILLFPF